MANPHKLKPTITETTQAQKDAEVTQVIKLPPTNQSMVNAIHESMQKNHHPQRIPGKPFDFSTTHLHISIPCYGGLMYARCVTSLLAFTLLAQKIGLTWSFDTLTNESLVQRGRNSLTAKMLANKSATHFMFIDADIGFEPESIVQMIVNDKDIMSGAYPRKSLPISYNINLKQQTKVQGPIYTLDTAATGFLMFKREVIETMIAAHPEWKYKDDIGLGKQFEPFLYAVFDCYIDQNGHYLSEDWAFCRRAQEHGYEIWCDSRIKLTHIGTYAFEGEIEKLQLNPRPTP